MRQVEKSAVEAFYAGKPGRWSNTQVTVEDDGWVYMFLHGSRIAKRRRSRVEVSSAGYVSSTTKSRLNAVLDRLGKGVHQHKGEWFINGPEGQESFPTHPGAWYVADYGSECEQLAYAELELSQQERG
jgi:hypothetical protein